MRTDVTVAIPTIPPRAENGLLRRALDSVRAQTHPAAATRVVCDERREGSWVTRQRALDLVGTHWVQFLDDDDELKPVHLERVLACAAETGADYVFSYFDTAHCVDPLGHFGKPFRADRPHHTTMTVLVRTELAQRVGFTAPRPGQVAGGEDWRFLLGCLAQNAHVVHLPERTWYWWHHGANTAGQPDRW